MTVFLAAWAVYVAFNVVSAATELVRRSDDVASVIGTTVAVTVAVSAANFATFWIALPANGVGVVSICKEFVR